jgi:phytol kinase
VTAATADLQGAALLSVLFLALLVAAEAWRRFGAPDPEHTRKLVHVGGGLVCLGLPFLIRSPLIVFALAASLSLLFAIAGRLGLLRSLHGVGRASRGAEYFPLAVLGVYLLARDRPWLYLSALLVLIVGDAFAALVGGRYGVVRYRVEESEKSLEGSLVFLVISFLAIHLPTLLLTDLPRPVTVLAATLVAILVTGFEAISLGGTDNLFVPIAVVVVLGKITMKPFSEIVFQNLSLLAILVAIGLVAWRRRALNVGGAVTFTLFAYGTWSLGSWRWALPALLGFAIFVVAWFRAPAPSALPPLRVRAIARAVLIPFLFVALANGTREPALFYGPYLGACAATLLLALEGGALRQGSRALSLVGAWVVSVAVIFLPPWLILRVPPVSLAAPVLVVALAAAVSTLVLRGARAGKGEWGAVRLLLAIGTGGAVLLLEVTGLVPSWDPTLPLWTG